MSIKSTGNMGLGPNAALISAVAYGTISIALTLFNKAVLSTYGFDSTMTLTLLQGLITILCLEFMKYKGWADFPSLNWDTARKVAPLSFVFISYVVVSLVSLGRVNVPMFTALRRLTILFVMAGEYILLGELPSNAIAWTVGVQALGAAIAAYKDMTYDPVSYFYLTLTNVFTALYTIYIKKVKKDTGLGVFAMLYYNNATTMPALLLMALWTGDVQRAVKFPYFGDIFFQVNFQASIFLAFCLNVSTYYSTTLNSPRTQTVVGQIKNFFAFLLGLVLFDDYIYDHLNFVGLIVGFVGSALYTWVEYKEKIDRETRAAAIAGGGAASSPSSSSSGAGGSLDGGGSSSPDAADTVALMEKGEASGTAGGNMTRERGSGSTAGR